MESYSIAEAKAQLSKLIRKVGSGRVVVITKHGKAVARLAPTSDTRNFVSLDEIKRHLDRQRPSRVRSAAILRKMRDEG
jgi:prevent-host-death family protein